MAAVTTGEQQRHLSEVIELTGSHPAMGAAFDRWWFRDELLDHGRAARLINPANAPQRFGPKPDAGTQYMGLLVEQLKQLHLGHLRQR